MYNHMVERSASFVSPFYFILLTSPGAFVLPLSGLELIPPCEERRGEDAVSGSELNTILLEGGRSIRFRT